jgi:hypothetical protein
VDRSSQSPGLWQRWQAMTCASTGPAAPEAFFAAIFRRKYFFVCGRQAASIRWGGVVKSRQLGGFTNRPGSQREIFFSRRRFSGGSPQGATRDASRSRVFAISWRLASRRPIPHGRICVDLFSHALGPPGGVKSLGSADAGPVGKSVFFVRELAESFFATAPAAAPVARPVNSKSPGTIFGRRLFSEKRREIQGGGVGRSVMT